MKKILPVLLCYVLTASQMYAVDGGPVFTSSISPIGTYSGVIEGITETDDTVASGPIIPGDPLPAPNNSASVPSNALGLFNLSVPAVGSATGAFVLFADGVFFSGAIDAFADPNNDKLIGVLEASTSITLTDITATGSTTTTVSESAVGQINAVVAGSSFSSSSLGSLKGTANLEVSYGNVDPTTLEPIIEKILTFNVLGVLQTETASASASSIGTGTTSSPTSSGG